LEKFIVCGFAPPERSFSSIGGELPFRGGRFRRLETGSRKSGFVGCQLPRESGEAGWRGEKDLFWALRDRRSA